MHTGHGKGTHHSKNLMKICFKKKQKAAHDVNAVDAYIASQPPVYESMNCSQYHFVCQTNIIPNRATANTTISVRRKLLRNGLKI
jgi:hypothetical protein